MNSTATPFDNLADGYDGQFSRTDLGELLRAAVWSRIDASFQTGDRVLDLGCGTGEDAIHMARNGVRVFALDASSRMVRVAGNKIAALGLNDRVKVVCRDLETLCKEDGFEKKTSVPRAMENDGPYDGALLNFGVVNCLGDPKRTGRLLARLVRPGGKVFLCVMGKYVPWEWLWFSIRGPRGNMFRRLGSGGCAWRGMTIRYPGVSGIVKDFGHGFRKTGLSSIGLFIPPSYAFSWCEQRPFLKKLLIRLESRFAALPSLSGLADHYLLELERK